MLNEKEVIGELKERLIYAMADTMSSKQFLKFKEHIENTTDYEFNQLLAELKHMHSNGQLEIPTTKEYLNLKKDMRKAMKVDKNDTGLEHIAIQFMSEERNKELLAWMSESKPTDIIRLTEEGDKEIMHLWECSRDEKIKEEGLTIPSDLFFANTIPLMDCEVYIDERKTGGHMIHFRVVIFSDYKERIANVDEVDLALVGAIEIPHNMSNISCSHVIPILVKSGVDVICTCEIAHRNMPSDLVEYHKQNAVMGDILQLGTQYLETWYGIQVSLLHPTVKDVFRKPRTAPKQDSKANKKKNHKPPKIRYIREHIVNATELAESAFGKSDEGKTINRKSLVWYVIGHWRVYENGKKVFVKPYFKGALREAGLPVDTREREIVKSELTDEADE